MFNASDMLALSPSAEELRKFLPMIGCHTMTVKKVNSTAVQKMLKRSACSKDHSIACDRGGDVEFVSYSGESFRC